MANTLKDYVYDDSFIERMNRAFSDLRADYELSMDADKEKVSELKAMHVDVKKPIIRLNFLFVFIKWCHFRPSWYRKNTFNASCPSRNQ